MFSKNKKIDSSVRKVDKIVTWIIIGWALAWLLWLSQTKKWKEITWNIAEKIKPTLDTTSKKTIKVFWKTIAFFVSMFNNKK